MQNMVVPFNRGFGRRQTVRLSFEISRKGQSVMSVCFFFIPASRFNGFSQAGKITKKIILLKLFV